MAEDPTPFRVDFNGSLRIEGRPERLTAEAGAIVLREVMGRMGIIEWLVERLVDPRKPEFITHPLSELMRTSLLLLGQGWRDQDDADALHDDAALRLAVSDRRGTGPLETRGAATTTSLCRRTRSCPTDWRPSRRSRGSSAC